MPGLGAVTDAAGEEPISIVGFAKNVTVLHTSAASYIPGHDMLYVGKLENFIVMTSNLAIICSKSRCERRLLRRRCRAENGSVNCMHGSCQVRQTQQQRAESTPASPRRPQHRRFYWDDQLDGSCLVKTSMLPGMLWPLQVFKSKQAPKLLTIFGSDFKSHQW